MTGGAGFIGRRVAAALLAQGAEVTVADLKPFSGDPSVRVVTGDLVEPEIAAEAVAPGTDVIIHLAARTSVLESLQDPEATYRNNVALTAGLLELARQQAVQTFLFASTNAVVGNVGASVITEQAPLRPLTPYGATKAASEMLINCYSAAYGVRGIPLRFSNVYGPGMGHKDSFIPRLMKAARDGTGVKVRGDGTMIRDVIQVDDVISGMFAAWRSDHSGPVILGSGQSVTVNQMVETARRVTGIDIPAENAPIQQGEMPAVKLDISVARSLGYSPTYDLEKGMATVWPDFDPNRTLMTEGAR
ncbi:MAG TPA: NAD-dependent epimerase/dehydratase family protein [Streptosporangiaceae bacterium]|nr:NAD-dependent epimerase/dehydratase family protein [Streptosporangiaceae bacterium]